MGHEEKGSARPNTIFSTKGLLFACPDVVTVARRSPNAPPPPETFQRYDFFKERAIPAEGKEEREN